MLYVVSTPIGNLGDITHRAVEVLKSVDLIACEDTRRTRILAQRYHITTSLSSYYEHNKFIKGEYFLRLLKEGKSVALVSDAGTPGISDPGFNLIRDAIQAGIDVVSIPGPTALVSALSISGLATDKFFFEGFFPVKSGARRKRLRWLKDLGVTIIAYESPHRILKCLQDMADVLENRQVVLVREVTKKFEESLRGDALSLLDRLSASKPKGEFVVLF
ncbi:MAG: 16S rRNA (cytidine(1402)-2'-O)-methyltransferase [Candidatus Omnitrophota bacterium]